jgi:2-octaprenyl-6-methoxyphenol hydroxylase
MNKNSGYFDLAIAGGGLTGCLMALSLAKLKRSGETSLSIAIVESKPLQQDISLSFDDRVIALSHGSALYLQQLGLWPALKTHVSAIKTIHISDRGHFGKTRVYAKDHQVPALGYVIELALLGKIMLEALADCANVHWFTPDTIESISWQQQSVTLALSSAAQINAELLLACDGAGSLCRQFANIKTTQKSYGQSALIANVTTSLVHNSIAYERFTNTGPIAMLPLPGAQYQDSRCSLVWSLPADEAAQMLQLDPHSFKQQLNTAFGGWLGEINEVGKRSIFPLNLVQAQQTIYHRMALIGNASHAIHPIAGQGFNLGVRDVAELADLVAKALHKPAAQSSHLDQQTSHSGQQALQLGQVDIGQFSLLNQYAENRKSDHQQVITLTDSLVTLFSNQVGGLVAGRNIALQALNYITPLKNSFVRKTMGH